MPEKSFSLKDVDNWFDTKVVKARTTRSGFSYNRIINGPRGLIMGNQPNPNGLCGDAAAYVADEFLSDKDIPDVTTSDGYTIGVILWDGTVLNHIANVMLVSDKTSKQNYKAMGKFLKLQTNTKEKAYDMETFSKLHVYDLYYKKRTNALDWWKSLDDSLGGTITLSTMSNMSD